MLQVQQPLLASSVRLHHQQHLKQQQLAVAEESRDFGADAAVLGLRISH
jgi:hypothetical protein